MIVVEVETLQHNRIGLAGTRRRRQLVRLCAVRLDRGGLVEHFDAIVDVEGDPPTEHKLIQMGLSPRGLTAACAPADLQRRWNAFVQDGDRLCAWNRITLDVLPPSNAGEQFVLKGIYASHRRRRGGSAEQACDAENLRPSPAVGPGRAPSRAAAATAVYHWLCASALRASKPS
jgi:hypothetical protein